MDIICDIDGTIADHEHRVARLLQDRDYEAYYLAAGQDKAIPAMRELVRSLLLPVDNRIVFLTGMPERFRSSRTSWLELNIAPSNWGWHGPLMRLDDDRRPNAEVKSDMLDALRSEGFNPELAIEDQSSVVDMWRRRGIVALQAREIV